MQARKHAMNLNDEAVLKILPATRNTKTPFELNTEFYNEVRRILPFIDTDTARFSEWLYTLRATYGRSTNQFYFEIPDVMGTNPENHARIALSVIHENARKIIGDKYNPDLDLVIFKGGKFWRVFLVHNGFPIMLCLFGRGGAEHSMMLVGDPIMVEFTSKAYEDFYKVAKSITLTEMLCFTDQGADTHDTTITENSIERAFDAFYPFIKGGLDSLVEEYRTSKDPIIFFYGPPGGGKSTLIREIMFRLDRENNYAVSSESVLTDRRFVPWLRKTHDGSFIAIEDAGAFVSPRGDNCDENSQMSDLLNYIKGINHTSSRILISSNITNTKKVDPALLRPGRTFRAIEFRRLTIDEANAARAAAGIKTEIDMSNAAALAVLQKVGTNPVFSLAEALNFERLAEQGANNGTSGFF